LKNSTPEAVLIGTQIWTTKNSTVRPTGSSSCYSEIESNCVTYGRLYDWGTAKNNVCPAGWHLPTNEEWATLTAYIGGTANAGTKLKAKSGWCSGSSANGTDDYGFAALPGGRYDDDAYIHIGTAGYWWSATELPNEYTHAYYMTSSDPSVRYDYFRAANGDHSVRCVKY
jgi:uncharacterized protein (TIGR02145 family)